MARQRGPRIKVFVPVTVNNYKYGFLVNEKKFNGHGSKLGQELATGVAGVFYGANAPKPDRARKEFKEGAISSYFAPDKRSSLLKGGWTLSSGSRRKGIRKVGKAVTVAVDTPHGYQYAWNITKGEVDKAKELGAVVPTDPDKLIWGSFPKPPRAFKVESSGTISTFVKPDLTVINAAAENGWSVEEPDPDWGI